MKKNIFGFIGIPTILLTIGLLSVASNASASAPGCTVNTYSSGCEVQTGCFDSDSFTSATKASLLEALSLKNYSLVTDQESPSYHNPDYTVELKFESHTSKVRLNLYYKQSDGSIVTPFSEEVPMGQDINAAAAGLIEKLPDCKI